MSISDEIARRWKATTGSLGIRLTDEDIERIGTAGIGDRVMLLDKIVQRTGARNVVPDYLGDTRKIGAEDEYQGSPEAPAPRSERNDRRT